MAKRGPKRKGEYGGKLQVMSTRITVEVHQALVKEAKISGRTFSGEVEHRLRESFEGERRLEKNLGGPEMYALLRTVAASMELAGKFGLLYHPEKVVAGESWLHDAFAYDQAVRAITTVLEAFRPEGDPSAPVPMKVVGTLPDDVAEALSAKNLGERAAQSRLSQIAEADPSKELPKGRIPIEGERLARSIAANLGPLHQRLKKGKSK